jgi:hypothetical protein
MMPIQSFGEAGWSGGSRLLVPVLPFFHVFARAEVLALGSSMASACGVGERGRGRAARLGYHHDHILLQKGMGIYFHDPFPCSADKS